jgi:hypothetical protein
VVGLKAKSPGDLRSLRVKICLACASWRASSRSRFYPAADHFRRTRRRSGLPEFSRSRCLPLEGRGVYNLAVNQKAIAGPAPDEAGQARQLCNPQLTKSARQCGEGEKPGGTEADSAIRRDRAGLRETAGSIILAISGETGKSSVKRTGDGFERERFGSPGGTSLRNGFGESDFEATLAGTNRVALL